MSSNILAIETSQNSCSVALQCGSTLVSRQQSAARLQAELLLPMVDEVLSEGQFALQDLDAVAFGRGPGSFTGIRIAASVAQGLAFGVSVPVLSISSLAALALAAMEAQLREQPQEKKGQETAILCVVDARMDELYAAVYSYSENSKKGNNNNVNGLKALLNDGLFTAEALAKVLQVSCAAIDFNDGQNLAVGDGCKQLESLGVLQIQEIASLVLASDVYATAEHILTLAQYEWAEGRAIKPELALPAYCRGSDAWTKQKAQK